MQKVWQLCPRLPSHCTTWIRPLIVTWAGDSNREAKRKYQLKKREQCRVQLLSSVDSAPRDNYHKSAKLSWAISRDFMSKAVVSSVHMNPFHWIDRLARTYPVFTISPRARVMTLSWSYHVQWLSGIMSVSVTLRCLAAHPPNQRPVSGSRDHSGPIRRLAAAGPG